ncbi:MAG: hypothetical protein JSU94_00550, partial [Phycisphaerales bacterium]
MSKRLSYFTCLVLAVCLGDVARAEINYEYIEAAAGVNFHGLADVDWGAVVRFGTSNTLTAGDGNWVQQCGPHRGGYGDTGEDFAFRWYGYIIVPVSGAVTFYVRSDDGSVLLIDDEVVIDNDGDHGTEGFPGDPGTVTLTAGAHKIEARMYERGGGNTFYLNWDVEGPTNITAVPDSALRASRPRQAMLPNPVDGAESIGKWFNGGVIQWGSGMDIAWHNVYFGTNPTPGAAEKRSRQALGNTFLFPDMYLARQPGTTYYWRVDEEAADGTIFTGEVWSFTTAPSAAHLPTPLDGQKWLDPCGITLEWRQGFNATTQDVYFGTDQAAVANATRASDEFIGNQATTFYSPGVLAEDTTYYWRVDQLNGGTEKGQVWKFSTVGKGEGVRGEYYHWSGSAPPPPLTAFSDLVLTRIDPQIDFNWGTGSPAPDVNVDLFAARWLGELETASTGSYTFYTNTDDGVRLWIDDQLVIENWTDHAPTIDTGSIDLLGDQRYSIQMDYYENGGGAVAELRWEGPSTPLQLVPPGALSLPLRATRPRPANGATGLGRMITLSWVPGERAVRHDVFLGESAEAVANATTATPGIYKGRQDPNSYFPPALLSIDKTYYWRIDEVNSVDPESPWKGSLWSFTTSDHILVDDFEDYNDYTPDRIFEWWKDGFGYGAPESPPYYQGNGTGSIVGYDTNPFVETNILHGGDQAMPYFFNNDRPDKAKYSEAVRRLSYPTRNWAEEGVRALSIWYRGYPDLGGGYVYDAGAGTYTVRAAGTDIWNVSDPLQAGYHDEFHFVYQSLDGAGTIVARVESVQNTNGWAKAGVMIRDTLDANSVHSMVVVTPSSGVSWQRRIDTGGASAHDTTGGLAA